MHRFPIAALRGAIALATLLIVTAAGRAPRAGAIRPAGVAADTLPPRDPIARLQARIDAGVESLPRDTALGYLPALLAALDIPESSQGLVFSRTSLQADRIAPWAPRAIYFNDDVYVGYVLESDFLEIASVDPDSGAVFYTLMQNEADRPRFQRETTACLMCHTSGSVTDGVPGFIVLSTFADRHGYPLGSIHRGSTTDRTPLRERWGGWYVTGTHAGAVHSGNAYSPKLHSEIADRERHQDELDLTGEGNLVDLEAKFHAEGYPSGHSDIVALMVLAHQAKVHNLITALHQAAETAFRREPGLRSAGPLPSGAGPRSGEELRIAGAADRLVQAMLFSGEAPLPGTVRGTSGFAEEFAARGPHDARGRSLREFDLERRLFRYPLSFLIYSEAFDALPELARRLVFRRIWSVLQGEERGADFDHLTEGDRAAILQILEETKPDFRELRR